MSDLESLAYKKLRSFALFPAKKRAKHEAAYALFGGAAREHLANAAFEAAATCLKQQARIAINKLQRPVESACHYLEATRAFMLSGELDAAFECLQLAVSARTKPTVKHKGDTELAVSGITVTDGRSPLAPLTASPMKTPETRPAAASVDSSMLSHQLAAPCTIAPTRSPALTAQAGTISIEGRGLRLSAETMEAPISSSPNATRSFSVTTPTSFSAPSAGLFSSPPIVAPAPVAASTNFLTPPPCALQRRHSLSGSANADNVTSDGVAQCEVLHIDLLLARLAVQLATDLWTDLDFRDGVLALEIASSLFATLLIAERESGGTFRHKRLPLHAPPLPNATLHIEHALAHAESASSPSTPVGSAPSITQSALSTSADDIEARLAGLLGPSAFATDRSSQTLGAGATLSSRPISSKPIPSLVASSSARDLPALVLHHADPHLSVGEGEGYFSESDPGTSILEESLVCRFQLANYYATYDEDLGEADRSPENQELRRAKALFEQVASQKPDVALVHATIHPLLASLLEESLVPAHVTETHVDEVATLIAQYAADDDKLHGCLFLAGLCDALIGIRAYQASQVRPMPIFDVKTKTGIVFLPPPPVPELYLLSRTVWCPPILLRYREMSPSFGTTCEIRLLRACNGLLQMAANLSARLNEAFGGSAPQQAKNLFQTAWGAEILREFTEIVAVYNQQRPLTNIAAKLLIGIKKAMRNTMK